MPMRNHEGRARAADIRREARAGGYTIKPEADGLWRPVRADGAALEPASPGHATKLAAWYEASDRAYRAARAAQSEAA